MPRLAVAIIVIAEFFGTSLWFSANAAADDLERAWGLAAAELGALTSAVQLGFITGTLVFALSGLADRFAASRIFAVCAVAGAATNAGFALLATGLVDAWAWRFATGFALAGVSVLSWPADDPLPSPDLREEEAPLFLPATSGSGDVVFGAAVMANTAEAGAPRPDGYIYVYGYRAEPPTKRLLAARVLPAEFDDPTRWRFWDGAAWQPEIARAAPLAGRVSTELSMSPLPDGRFLLVFQLDTIGRDVVGRVARTPIGPFGPVQRIWRCPEPDRWPGAWCYNAKAHPHLSGPAGVIISYNVSTRNLQDLLDVAEIYRPRFIRVRMSP